MNSLYLLLGSNLGDSENQLAIARKYIAKSIGPVIRKSKLYQTAAWGKTDQPDFLNQVIVVNSKLDAFECLEKIMMIEQDMGRKRTIKNAPRIIDIDILFFNKDIIQSANLIIPHPEIQNRRFVLTPLNELAPGFVHPVLAKTNHELLLKCRDKLNVKKI